MGKNLDGQECLLRNRSDIDYNCLAVTLQSVAGELNIVHRSIQLPNRSYFLTTLKAKINPVLAQMLRHDSCNHNKDEPKRADKPELRINGSIGFIV